MIAPSNILSFTLKKFTPLPLIPGTLLSIMIILFSGFLNAQHLQLSEVVQQEVISPGFSGPTILASDPSGTNLYVVSRLENALAVYSKNTITDSLSISQYFEDDNENIDGMTNATDVALTPDGKYLYVASVTDNAVAIFARNTSTGLLTFSGIKDMSDIGTGVVISLEITADGQHLYSGNIFGGVKLFSIDPDSGELTYVDAYGRGDGVTFSPNTMIISPDDNHLYATSSPDSTVTIFSRNTTTGELTLEDTFKNETEDEILFPGFMEFEPGEGNHLYMLCGDSVMVTYERNTTTGSLSFLEMQKQGVNNVDGLAGSLSGLAVDPAGENIYIANSRDSSITIFDRDPDTGLLTYNNTVNHNSNGIGGCTNLLVSQEGEYLFTLGNTENSIATFHRSASTGSLTYDHHIPTDTIIGNLGLARPTILASDPSGTNTYIISRLESTLAVYSRDAGTGSLSFQQLFQDGVEEVDGLSNVTDIAFTPDGKYLYVASFTDNAVAIFARNTSTGLLTYSGIKDMSDYGTGVVISLEVTADGQHLYSGNIFGGVKLFSIDPGSGEITYEDAYGRGDGINFSPNTMIISPDDKHLYVTSSSDSTVTIFSRNTTTGELTLGDTFKNKPEDEILFPGFMEFEPGEGKYLYMLCSDSTIITYERNTTTGSLTFLEMQKQGINNVDGLAGSLTGLTVDPAGEMLYIASRTDSSITIFDRDPDTGKLTYSGTITENEDNITGIGGCYDIAVSPDNEYLYAVGNADSSIAIFKILTPPAAPAGLLATENEDHIGLSWNSEEADITSFQIFRSEENDPASAEVINSTGGASTSYSDNMVTQDIVYYYWIKAVDTDGLSSWFSQVDSAVVSTVTAYNSPFPSEPTYIYPNPATDFVHVQINESEGAETELINMQGQVIRRFEMQAKTERLDISGLISGPYYLKISGDKDVQVIKLIKE